MIPKDTLFPCLVVFDPYQGMNELTNTPHFSAREFEGAVNHYAHAFDMKVGEQYGCLGEVSNMPGHYVIVVKDRFTGASRVHFGLHDDFFRVMNPETD